MTIIIQAAEQVLRENKASRGEEENNCALIWGTISDHLSAAEPDELQKLDSNTLRSLTIVVVNNIGVDVPGVPDHWGRARLFNEVLRSSLKLNSKISRGINPALLEKLDALCLESFQAHMEDRGFHLTDWDKIIKEPANPELRNLDIMGGTPQRGVILPPTSQQPTREEYRELGLGDMEIVRNPDESDVNWRVRRFRSSYHERHAAMQGFLSELLGGGVIEK